MAIYGFADLHCHQFANLGFGGVEFFGSPSGTLQDSLPWCTSAHGPGGIGDVAAEVMRFVYNYPFGIGHKVGGYPQFDGWPRFDSLTHQVVHREWLERAWRGGMRLMVMLAVNNEWMAHFPMMARADGNDGTDMQAAWFQVEGAKELQDEIDSDCGGPGKGWYRIVNDPMEALDVMRAGKLAVVLGIEVDYLFNSYRPLDASSFPQLDPTTIPPWVPPPFPALDEAGVRAAVKDAYDRGVRYVFPIHFANNMFGGSAYQNGLAYSEIDLQNEVQNPVTLNTPWGAFLKPNRMVTVPDPVLGFAQRNVEGLTPLGETLLRELMGYGMMFDLDHMSYQSRQDSLALAEQEQYPVVSGHTGFNDILMGKKHNETQLSLLDVDRIRRLGGMVAPIILQGNISEVQTWTRPDGTSVPHVIGVSTNTFAQAYLYAVEKMQGGPVALGTDFNGFAGVPGPRAGSDVYPDQGTVVFGPVLPEATYPFTTGEGVVMDQCVAGERTFHIDYDGLAHVGLLPDLIADLQAMGVRPEELDPLLHSAEGFANVWKKAWLRDGALVRTGDGTVWVIYGQARFHVPDPGTLQGLFPNTQVRETSSNVDGIPQVPVDGTLLREGNGTIWVIAGGARFHVPDPVIQRALFGTAPVHQLWDHAMDGVPVVPRDGTLLREQDGTVWVVLDGARLHVPDPPTLGRLYGGEPIIQLWDGAADSIPTAPNDGAVFREERGTLWGIVGGARLPVADPAVLDGYIGGRTILLVWNDALAALPTVPKDGTTLKEMGSDQTYMVEGGRLVQAAGADHVEVLWHGALAGLPKT
ncbi:membrane dipeptidase [Sinomonas albida]|uniref:membrane dipeptidase n=1 Tax=Sinomonas albida TaxID=369942 RepID=UPI0030186D62